MGVRQILKANGRTAIEHCECQAERRVLALLRRAGIPERYVGCTLENFKTGGNQSLWNAHNMARKFVDGYPATTGSEGLLFIGTVGVGKTHLATGILQALVVEKGVRGLFCDYRDLLKQIQNSYNPSVAVTELEVLRPVFDAEVLLIDELGAVRRSDWVWDTVALILNTRYNKKRTTLITTNFADKQGTGLTPAPAGVDDRSIAEFEKGGGQPRGGRHAREAQQAMRDETLGDRIGETMRSRLAQMCVTVEIIAEDYRRNGARARFA